MPRDERGEWNKGERCARVKEKKTGDSVSNKRSKKKRHNIKNKTEMEDDISSVDNNMNNPTLDE